MLISSSKTKEELNDWNPVGGIFSSNQQFNGVVHIVPNISFFAAELTGLDFDQQLFKE